MNDIDSRLRSQSTQTPGRPLTKDFSDFVMERSLKQPAQFGLFEWLSGVKTAWAMKLHLKHAILVIGMAAALLLGGSGYAAIRWIGYDDGAAFGGVTTLQNGDTRFWVSSKGHCSDHVGKLFYEIKKNAPITPAQIADMVAGTCETTGITSLFPGLPIGGTMPTGMSARSGEAQLMASTQVQTQYYLTSGTLKANNGTTMTLAFSTRAGDVTQTFPVNADQRIFDDGQPISLVSLKPGDPMQLIMSIPTTYAAISKLALDWQAIAPTTLAGSSIYGILKTHHAVYDMHADATEFTQLVPNPKDIRGMSFQDVSAYDQDPTHLHEEHPL